MQIVLAQLTNGHLLDLHLTYPTLRMRTTPFCEFPGQED